MKVKSLFLFLLLVACAQKTPFEGYDSDNVVSKPTPESTKIRMVNNAKGLLVEGTSDSCYVAWQYFKKTKHLEVENYQCMLSLEESRFILDQMMKKLLTQLKRPDQIKTFGGPVRNFHDLEQRIVIHAYSSEDWNHSIGEPTRPNLSKEDYIINYANKSNAHFEITSFFGELCLDVNVIEVKDVAIFQASSLHYYPYLRKQKMKRRAQVPTNYDIKFELKPKHTNCFPE